MRLLAALPALPATAVLASAVVLAGCGSGEGGRQPPRAAGAPAPGGGLSVQEALDSDLDGPLMVRGYLIESDGELRLCEAILESSPPQCGEPSLRVDGPALRASGKPISLLGDVEGGTITVSEAAIG